MLNLWKLAYEFFKIKVTWQYALWAISALQEVSLHCNSNLYERTRIIGIIFCSRSKVRHFEKTDLPYLSNYFPLQNRWLLSSKLLFFFSPTNLLKSWNWRFRYMELYLKKYTKKTLTFWLWRSITAEFQCQQNRSFMKQISLLLIYLKL